jgi:GNAT superfamily N-acetyltransferase
MNKLIRLFRPVPELRNFRKEVVVRADTYNKVESGEVFTTYYDGTHEVGYVCYRPHNGQIGNLWLDPKYRGYGLGTQIIGSVLPEVQKAGAPGIWAVTFKEHKFWSNLIVPPYGHWTRCKPAHPSIRGEGYALKFDQQNV